MNIVHVILLGAYTDGFSYQENLLPKYHKKAGHNVSIIASPVVINNSGQQVVYEGPARYTDSNGIEVIRLPFKRPERLSAFFRRYKGLEKALAELCPEVLFIHSCQFLEIKAVARYVKKHPGVSVYVDNHADFNNSARRFLSRKILHGMIWKRCAKSIEPYTKKFYGVVPARVDFLQEAYGIPAKKCALLVMGADDDEVEKALTPGVRERRRTEFGIEDGDLAVVTGGKIDSNKPQVIALMKAVNRLPDNRVKLLVFGSVAPELRKSFDKQCSARVKHIGWQSAESIYEIFAAADLAAFPGLHSVLWEQAAGMGKPCLFKRVKGFEHIDLGGNCLFFENDSEEEYMRVLLLAAECLETLRRAAEQKGRKAFSYREIARKAIE